MFKLNIVDKTKEKITNDWSIERVATEYTPKGWENVFEDAKHEIKDVSDILEKYKIKNGPWYPDNNKLFLITLKRKQVLNQ